MGVAAEGQVSLLAPWVPSAADPFDLRKAGHLLRRAGFGGSLRQRRELVRSGVDAAVRSLFPAADQPAVDRAQLDAVVSLGDIDRVRSWRVLLALESTAPLRVRMSALWHDHFATSNQKVLDPRAMALQQAMFDEKGLGTFDELLLGVAQDPAMLRWLDNDVNVSGRPNENFARELFELFALGRGTYSEVDVREAARAFTGWHVRDGRFFFAKRLHDDGQKVLFGRSGGFGGEEVVRAVVEREESARHVARCLLECFVHPEPTEEEVGALATCYREQRRHLGDTLAVLLRSQLFFSARAYRSRIRSPADWVVGTVRTLGATAAPTDLSRAMGQLGELWLEPPSVEGWPRERQWLTEATWLLRTNFVADLLAGRRGKFAPAAESLFGNLKRPADRAKAALLMVVDGDASEDGRQALERLAAGPAAAGPDGAAVLLHAACCLPEAQLL
ncbi:MAG: hypothetical protein RL148_593 [Planctomycetota bacterium]